MRGEEREVGRRRRGEREGGLGVSLGHVASSIRRRPGPGALLPRVVAL